MVAIVIVRVDYSSPRRLHPDRGSGRSRVEAGTRGVVGPAPIVIGLPGGVIGLEENLGVAGVVANHEDDHVHAPGLGVDQVGEVDARDGGRRYGPGGRDSPVAGVNLAGRGVAEWGRLVLWRNLRR